MDELSLIPRGALMLGQLQATPEMAAAYAQRGIDAGAMELLPRITRAQSMDILSLPGQSRRLPRRHRGARPPSTAASRC